MSRHRRVDTTTADDLLSFILAHREKLPEYALLDERRQANCHSSDDVKALVAREDETRQQRERRFRDHAEAIVRVELGEPSLLPGHWVAAVVIEDLLVLRHRSRATHAQGAAPSARRTLRDLARPVDVTPRRGGRGRPRASAADRERQRQGLILKHLPWLYESRDWASWYALTGSGLLARAGRAARFLLHRQRAPRFRLSHSWPEPSLVDDTIELAILERVQRSRVNPSVSADGRSDPRNSLEWQRAGLRVDVRQRPHPFPAVAAALVDALSAGPIETARRAMAAGHTRCAE